MNCNPTLTADEFRTLHNGLWDLDRMVGRLMDIDLDEGTKLAEIAKTLRDSLAGAYHQDDAAFKSKSDHFDDVKSQLGMDHSEWSIYEVNNMANRHPFEGVDRVVYCNHWGERPVSCSINGLTWAALWIAANACIRDSGDEHHVYIEGFQPDPEDSRTLVLSTGS